MLKEGMDLFWADGGTKLEGGGKGLGSRYELNTYLNHFTVT